MASLAEIIAALLKRAKPTPVVPKPTPIVEQPKVEVKTEVKTVVTAPIVQPTSTNKAIPPGKTRAAATARYGAVVQEAGKLVWKDEAKWMTMFVPPTGFEHWVNTASNRPVAKIYCNKDMHAPLKQALENLKTRGLDKELKTFDGCFQLRMVRGTTDSLSSHAYGLAIDTNAAENGLGKEPKLSKEFVQAFKDAGFSWGGDFKRKDGMHFSFCFE